MLFTIFLVGIGFELLVLWSNVLWAQRKTFIAFPLALTTFASAGLIYERLSPWVVPVIIVLVFRLFNLIRVASSRIHEKHLRHSTRRTSIILGIVQVLCFLPLLLEVINVRYLLIIYLLAMVVFGVLTFLFTIRNIYKTRFISPKNGFSDSELPSVTVAIPARNETDDLEACLKTVVASNYPKLEILVLDDCSQEKTAEIIRSFAQSGVRFIKGSEPSENWLPKNKAYDRLADEANGEYILFCGVDVRFNTDAIRNLVVAMKSKNKQMISVLPRRLTVDIRAVFVQPLRYWWELALPRKLFNRPPVLSTCWMINKSKLKNLGGFDAVRRSILPERFFARELIKSDEYKFIRANDQLDVQTRKSITLQRDTAIRMRYPQIKKRPELALLLTVLELLFMIGPFIVLIISLIYGSLLVAVAASVAITLLIMTHVLIIQISNPANVLSAVISFPVSVIIEIIISYISMYKYEFSDVIWKGRNICVPVMRIEPKLPALKD